MALTAAQKVFGLQELLDQILLELTVLPPQRLVSTPELTEEVGETISRSSSQIDLLCRPSVERNEHGVSTALFRLQRVNRQFRDTIAGFRALRDATVSCGHFTLFEPPDGPGSALDFEHAPALWLISMVGLVRYVLTSASNETTTSNRATDIIMTNPVPLDSSGRPRLSFKTFQINQKASWRKLEIPKTHRNLTIELPFTCSQKDPRMRDGEIELIVPLYMVLTMGDLFDWTEPALTFARSKMKIIPTRQVDAPDSVLVPPPEEDWVIIKFKDMDRT